MIVHGPSMSPFVRKVMAAIAEKGLTAEFKTGVRPGSPDADWRAISPTGKVPGLEDGNYRLADSSAICHYLDAKYPAVPLIPAEAEARGRVVWFDEYADTIAIGAIGKMFFNRVAAPLFGMTGDLAAAAAAEVNEVPPVLAYLESQVAAGDFLVGDTLTLADLAVASALVNFEHAGGKLDGYPALTAHYARMTARPSFANWVAAERKMLGKS